MFKQAVEVAPLFLCLDPEHCARRGICRSAPEASVYAIIKSGNKQYRVQKGDRIEVERLPHAVGEEITLKDVLFVGDGDTYRADAQAWSGAAVVARVLAERKGRKVISFDYRNKHRRRTTRGHRQIKTHLEIKDIVLQ
jgi:large subunit ribosomal protein L21